MSTPRSRFVFFGAALAAALTFATSSARAGEQGIDRTGAPVAETSPASFYTYDGRVETATVMQTLVKALATKKDIFLFSGDLGCSPTEARPSFDEDLVSLTDLLTIALPFPNPDDTDWDDDVIAPDDEMFKSETARYPGQITVVVAVTERELFDMADEVKASANGGGVAIFAFCNSASWIKGAKNQSGQSAFLSK